MEVYGKGRKKKSKINHTVENYFRWNNMTHPPNNGISSSKKPAQYAMIGGAVFCLLTENAYYLTQFLYFSL